MLQQGSIVRAYVLDPQGRNRKLRPLLIVTPTNEISTATQLLAVAITGAFREPLQDDEVAMPFHPQGSTASKLTKRCIAKCTWQVTIHVSDVEEIRGFLPGSVLLRVLKVIESLP